MWSEHCNGNPEGKLVLASALWIFLMKEHLIMLDYLFREEKEEKGQWEKCVESY